MRFPLKSEARRRDWADPVNRERYREAIRRGWQNNKRKLPPMSPEMKLLYRQLRRVVGSKAARAELFGDG